eukprot:COSAG06_NODE_29240_length_560_cov_0.878525_1_plen_29_part_10
MASVFRVLPTLRYTHFSQAENIGGVPCGG